MLSVIDFHIELALNAIVNQNARLDVHVVVLIVPVRLECDRDAIPALRVGVAQTVTANLDNTLCHHVWLLAQMNVVLVWIVERAHCTD